jgi:cytochrome c peroxidase
MTTIRLLLTAAAPAVLLLASRTAISDDSQRHISAFPNDNGVAQTFTATGPLDTSGPFFQSLGTNGRSCATCHQPGDNWSVTPNHIRQRFDQTQGRDPIFRTNDGSNCDNLDVSTVPARRAAYSQLLNKGLIRVSLDVPAGAEFTVTGVDSPYGCTSTTTLALYRRPLPSTNLRFLTAIMWDGREASLLDQANDATTGHAQGQPLSAALRQQIVDFESSLTTAQIEGPGGALDEHGAKGGAMALVSQVFSLGINDPLDPTKNFTPNAFDMFSALASADQKRQAIARGEALFNSKPITITGVAGLNDKPGLGTLQGTCTTCHNTPNVGNHSVPLAINIGLNDPSHRTPDMPLYTLENRTTHAVVQTMDPGKAMISGKWADIGKTKGPVLRGLSGRAPYFHNGAAATLLDAVNFYDTRFGIGLSQQEKNDLVAFLSSL